MNDQQGITLASDYDITNWGQDASEIDSIFILNELTGEYDLEIKKPTQEQINQLAEDKLNAKFEGEFTIVDAVHDSDTGLDAILLMNQNGEYFVIFQGSQWTYEGKDWFGANFSLALNELDPQHLAALDKVAEWKAQYNVKGAAGNSLAGTLVQLIIMANPDMYGWAINPAGINKGIRQFMMEKYGLTEEMMKELDMKNFYTDTDILHKVLGLEDKDQIRQFNEKYPYLSQMGQQIFHQSAGDFSLENMGIEHTGTDRVTIYGPFDPLTGNFIVSEAKKENGFTHYTTQPTTTIELNVTELVDMATKLARSLDAHDDEMVRYFKNLAEILDYSCGDMTSRKTKLADSLEELLDSNIIAQLGVKGPDWLANMAVSLFSGGTLDAEVRQAIGHLKMDMNMIRENFQDTISKFLTACGIKVEMHTELIQGHMKDDALSGYYVVPYYTDNFLEKPMEKALATYIRTRANEAEYVHNAMHYYARAILHAASVFAQADETLANKIAKTVSQIDAYGPTSQSRNDIMNPPVMSLFPVDQESFLGGVDAKKREIMGDNMDVFQKFFTQTIDDIRDCMLGDAITILQGLKKEPSSNSYYQRILDAGTDPSNVNYDYRAYNEACNWQYQNEQRVKRNELLTESIMKLTRAQNILANLPIQEVLVKQFQDQILHLLFAGTELYELVNNAQRIAAHSSIAALLISQTNSNLSYNSGKAIDSMKEIGEKIQIMLEIQMSHMERIKV